MKGYTTMGVVFFMRLFLFHLSTNPNHKQYKKPDKPIHCQVFCVDFYYAFLLSLYIHFWNLFVLSYINKTFFVY